MALAWSPLGRPGMACWAYALGLVWNEKKKNIVTGTNEGKIYMYDFPSLELIKSISAHSSTINFLKFSNSLFSNRVMVFS